MMRNFLISTLVLFALNAAPLQAQTIGEIVEELTPEELALDAAAQASLTGPREIILPDQAVLHLRAGFKFIPRREAEGLLLAWGNAANPQLVGLVLPEDEEKTWTVLIEQAKEGYVSDAEAKNWNPDDLLATLKLGAVADNKDRKARGFPAVEVLDWKQAPVYDPSLHRLTWALQSRDEGSQKPEDISINYNTYALGRDGYFKFNLVTDPANFDHDEAIGQHVLADFKYNKGKGYGDFQVQSDKAATYSIGTLVSGEATASGQPTTAATWWDFIEANSRYLALASAIAALLVYLSGRKK